MKVQQFKAANQFILTLGAMSRIALQKCSNLAQMLLANLLIARVTARFSFAFLF